MCNSKTWQNFSPLFFWRYCPKHTDLLGIAPDFAESAAIVVGQLLQKNTGGVPPLDPPLTTAGSIAFGQLDLFASDTGSTIDKKLTAPVTS